LLEAKRPLMSPTPLVLDLDGTLIHTDTFHEMMVDLLVRRPFILFLLPFWFIKGRPYAKAQLIKHAHVNLETLPYNKHLLSVAKDEALKGRPLILATGTDQGLAQKISDHLGFFQEVIGSDGKINMTGAHKRKALVDRFGPQGFDYAGDSTIDTFVWKASRKALVVCPKRGVLKAAHSLKKPEEIHYIPRENKRFVSLILALRPLFWIINLFASSSTLFFVLSFLSSGFLILGDLLAIEKERCKNHKWKSVFARGELNLLTAFLLVPLLILPSFFILLFRPGGFIYLCGYGALFLVLDRCTRCTPQPLRWGLLGLLQILAVWGGSSIPFFIYS